MDAGGREWDDGGALNLCDLSLKSATAVLAFCSKDERRNESISNLSCELGLFIAELSEFDAARLTGEPVEIANG